MSTILKLKFIVLFSLLFVFVIYSQKNSKKSPIDKAEQVIIVLTDSANVSDGNLFRLERDKKLNWDLVSEPIPIIIGKNGFAVGKGLIRIESKGMKSKVEGDGKSPAGVFSLTKAFGFLPKTKLKGLKIPYIQVTGKTECVDDPKSKFYNQIVRNNKVDTVD